MLRILYLEQILILIIAATSSVQPATVYVGSAESTPCREKEPCYSLNYYAQHPWGPRTNVVFLPGKHTLDQNLLVTVSNVTDLTLRSLNTNCSVVKCYNNSGFAFRGVSNLELECLQFVGCGHYSEPGDCGGLYVALLFGTSSNITMNNVTVEHSTGYGVCGQDIHGYFDINNSLFQYNAGSVDHHGGNFQLFYRICLSTSINVTFSATRLQHEMNPRDNSHATGLTVILLCLDATVDISVENSTFENNTASIHSGAGGHVYVVMQSLSHHLTMVNTLFTSGQSFEGGGIFITLDPKFPNSLGHYSGTRFINVHNCTFTNNSAYNQGGAVYIIYHEYAISQFIKERDINFTLCTFRDNSVAKPSSPFGTALYVIVIRTVDYEPRPIPQLKLLLQDCTFAGNSLTVSHNAVNIAPNPLYPCGQLYATELTLIVIDGSTIANSSCSAIMADHSSLLFSGYVELSNNTALRGGAMYLGDKSIFYLTPYSEVSIAGNQAEYGGGIFVEQSSQCFLEEIECFYQLNKDIQNNSSLLTSVQVKFHKNAARTAGHDIFGGSVKKCYFLDSLSVKNIFKPPHVFQTVFNFSHMHRPSYISSTPYGVCFCLHNRSVCSYDLQVSVYPGQTFSAELLVVGQENGPVPGSIAIKTESNVTLKELQYLQTVPSTYCTNISFTVFSNKINTSLTLRANAWCRSNELIDKHIYITFKECTVGFQARAALHDCECIGDPYFVCDIDSEKIVRHSPFWVGFDGQDPEKSVAVGLCPYDYCKMGEVRISTNSNFLAHNSQCDFGRTGVLCGKCPNTTSTIIGGSKCVHCANGYLILTIALAGGGVVLVIAIMALDMTVSHGTINGLLFYVNIVQVLNSQVFPHHVHRVPVLFQFVSWFNLNLGIPTCFYNGMDTYSKVWLQWVFPLYILFIVVTIIMCARRSTVVMRLVGRNATNILATLLLLSYSKIIQNTISVFVFSPLKYIPYGTHWKTVWTLDGTIPYGSTKHIPMIIVGIIAVFMALPYIAMLLCVQCFRRINHRSCHWTFHLKPLTDAYTGVYKDQYGFWTGHLLLARAAIYIIATFGIVEDEMVILGCVIAVCIHLLTLSIWLFRGVYKHWLLDVLESSFIVNLCILCATTALVRKGSVTVHQTHVTYISIGVAFATFMGIVLYHIHLRLLLIDRYQQLIEYFKNKFHPRAEYEPLLNVSRGGLTSDAS